MSGAEELAFRVRGVTRGTLATIAGRGFDVLATYVFYATVARSIPVDEFGRFVVGFTILQFVAPAARLGLDQALLAINPDGAANRFGAIVVVATSTGIAAATVAGSLITGHALPTFGLWLAAALPCMAAGQYVAGALRASGNVVIAAAADSVVQPAVAAAGALIVSAQSPAASNFALAFAISWAVTLLFGFHVRWRVGRLDRSAFLRSGRSMLGVVVMHQAAASADILILGAFAATTEVARYAVAQKIASAFLLLHGAITTAATPFMRTLTSDRTLLAHYYHSAARWMLTLALPLLVVCIAAPQVMLSIFGPAYAGAGGAPLVLLSVAAAVLVASGPAGSTLLCTGHAPELFRVTARGAGSTILAVALLARFGAIGVAAGVLIGRLIGRGLLMTAMRRFAKIGLADAPLLFIGAAALIGVGIARVSAPLGAIAALALALFVLVRSGDVAVILAEVRRT